MFNAIADQLHLLKLMPIQFVSPSSSYGIDPEIVLKRQVSDPIHIRRIAAQYMRDHQDDFINFIPSVNGEDTVGATEHEGVITPEDFRTYCKNVEETGEWGGEPEASYTFLKVLPMEVA
jgi:hypothetical protein